MHITKKITMLVKSFLVLLVLTVVSVLDVKAGVYDEIRENLTVCQGPTGNSYANCCRMKWDDIQQSNCELEASGQLLLLRCSGTIRKNMAMKVCQ